VLLWYLIEELLDCQSIEGCRTVFDYLESRGERLVAVRINLFEKEADCPETFRESFISHSAGVQ
jgi:hypothetical protein